MSGQDLPQLFTSDGTGVMHKALPRLGYVTVAEIENTVFTGIESGEKT